MPLIINDRPVVEEDHGSARPSEVKVSRSSQLSKMVPVKALRTHFDGRTMRQKDAEFPLPLRSLRQKIASGLVAEVAPSGRSSSPGGGLVAGRFDAERLEAMGVEELQEIADVEGLEVEGTGKGRRVLKRDLVSALLKARG